MGNSVLDWQPSGACGVQAALGNGQTVYVDGWRNGDGTESGFALVYLYATYKFSTRADAYMAAELLATALYLQNND